MTWFTRLRSWQTDAANGIGIRADYHDSEDDNFALGINSSLNIAGLNSPTANIPMGGFKITGAAVGTAANDYATVSQVQSRVVAYAADSVGTDDYAITLSPALSAYAVGQSFYFAAGTANTGSATLNINGLGAKTIKKDYNVDLSDGDIAQNKIIHVVYDGTNFQMQTPSQGTLNQALSAIYAADGGGSDSYAITLSPAPAAYVQGMMLNFKANTANTGGASLNVNGLGAKTIVKDGSLALDTGDIKASQIVQVVYDGTNFQMSSPKSYVLTQNCSAIYAADAGSTDTYAITLTPTPTAYTNGMVVHFKANTANTGAATLNVNSLGAVTIKKFGTTNDLATGDILANQIVCVIYDGTNFQMLSCVDDIANLTAKSSVDSANDLVKIWDNAASTYKKATPSNFVATALPAGSVLQVVQVTKTDTFSTASTSYTDLTGMSASITPASSSNKILVLVDCKFNSGGNSACVRLVRGSTTVYVGDTASSRILASAQDRTNETASIGSGCIMYLDSPATTSSTTYKLQAITNTGTFYLNRSSTDTDSATFARTASSITLMEIKG